MPEPSKLLRREPLPRVQLDAMLASYRATADRYGPGSKRALRIRNELIEVNMRLAATVARWYRVPAGWALDDLLALAVPGLITAIERFDLDRGVTFATFAAWWIRHSLSRALADTAGTIRVPVHTQGHLARETRDGAELTAKWADDARAARRVLSLDVPLNSEDGPRTWVEQTPGEFVDPADMLDADRAARALHAQIDALPERQRFVISERMEGRTLTEVGADLEGGRSRERVRQLEQEALAMMRPRLAEVADLASGC